MSENQNEPRAYDAVRGGQNSIPVNAAVLGGLPGVKSRLASPIVEVRIAALSAALKYGEAGLDLIVEALYDESMQVRFAAYELLKDRAGLDFMVEALYDESMQVRFAAYELLKDRDDLKIKPQFQDYLPTFEFDVITVNNEGKENSRRKSFAHYFPEDLGNGVVLEMVYIPGGTFMMGSPATEAGCRHPELPDNERPQHQVTVPTFYAGKYPITQEQWETITGNNPSRIKGEKRPVEQVTWNDAVNFCQQLSEKTGKNYRLPSEAEWEYACRAGTTTAFHFGEIITADLANYQGNETTVVGSFPSNAFGLYDMHGNVWEWCQDCWHFSNYNGAPSDGSAWERNGSHNRVLRGGSWNNYAEDCRAAYRRISSAGGYSDRTRGFRVAAFLWLPASPSSVR